MGKLTHTVSGSVASFKSADKADIESLKAYFLPIQNGSGDPSPTNIRPIIGWTGTSVYNDPSHPGFINWNQIQQDGNMEDINMWEVGNDYGTMSISNNVFTWTCTSQPTQFYHTGFRIKNGAGNSNFLSIPYDHKILVSAYVRCSVSTRIRIYGLVSNTGNTYIYSYNHNNSNIPANEWVHLCGFISDRPSTPPSSASDVIIKRFKPTLMGTDANISTITAGTTFEMKNFMAFDLTQMFGAGNEPTVNEFTSLFDLSTYKTYNLGMKTTVSMVNGVNPSIASVSFPATKNLLDTSQHGRKDGGSGFSASQGVWSFESVNGGNSCLVWGTQTFNAGTYTLSAKCSGNGISGFRLLCSSSSCGGTWLEYYGGYYLNPASGADKITFTTTESFTMGVVFLSNSSHLKEEGMLYDIQLENGSSASLYEPYGTFYGGYVDPIKGKLVAQYEILTDTWGNWGTATDQGDGTVLRYRRFTHPVYGNGITNHYTDYCNVAKYVYANENGNTHYYIVGSSYNCRVYLPTDFPTDQTIQVIGKLITPIEYDLSPQQLKTLLGQNNIWSNANDITEVEYEFADYLAKKRLSLNEPHIATATGVVASFNTDMKANLASIKVEFTPVQEGSGDPSPSNIRPITGWTGCKLYHTGKNMLPVTTTNNYEWFIPGNVNVTASTGGGNEYGMPQIVFYDKNVNQISYRTLSIEVPNEDRGYRSFPTDESYYYRLNRNPSYSQMEIGSSLTSYEEPNCTSYPITFPIMRNLWEANESITFTQVTNVYFNTPLPAGSYVFSCIATSSDTDSDKCMIYVYENGSPLVTKTFGRNQRKYVKFTSSNPIDRIILYASDSYQASDGDTATFSNIMIESGTAESSYEPFGTVYGGSLDLTTGVLTKKWFGYTFTGNEQMGIGSYSGTGGVRINSTIFDNMDPSYNVAISNMAVKEATVPTSIDKFGFRVSGGSSRLAFFIPNGFVEGETTVEKFKEWLAENQLMICSEIATPITYQLTPQQIKSIVGQNNIWSNTNGNTTVKYWKH